MPDKSLEQELYESTDAELLEIGQSIIRDIHFSVGCNVFACRERLLLIRVEKNRREENCPLRILQQEIDAELDRD